VVGRGRIKGENMNPWDVVAEFEQVVADYGGAPYGVAVDSCTNALLLCCKFCNVSVVEIPCFTYVGVPQSICNAGGSVRFLPYTWSGVYRLTPYPIYDSARRFRRNMVLDLEYTNGYPGICYNYYYYCLSFHMTKHIPIGRGGMILTNDAEFQGWCKKARFDGRTERVPPREDSFIRGWHMLMEPEQALRGLRLMTTVKDYYDDLPWDDYTDLSKQGVFNVSNNP
jgi:hypothetical protein